MADWAHLYWTKKDLKKLHHQQVQEKLHPPPPPADPLPQPHSLYLDAEENDIEDCIALIEAGASVNERRGARQVSPLHVACEHGRFEIASQLLSRGADLHLRDALGFTPLALALKWRRNAYGDVTRLLVAAEADVNATDSFGKVCVCVWV